MVDGDNEIDDGSIDYPAQYEELGEQHKQLIGKLDNHLRVLMSSTLEAAKSAHIVSCLVDKRHAAQEHISNGMHSSLIVAGVCALVASMSLVGN